MQSSQRLHLFFIQRLFTGHSLKTSLCGRVVSLIYPTKFPSAPATVRMTESMLAAPRSFTAAA